MRTSIVKKVSFTVLLFFPFLLFSQSVPSAITYQGILWEGGLPATGSHNFEFTINAWTELHNNVSVDPNGRYTVVLGGSTTNPNPLSVDIFEGQTSIAVSIKVDGDPLSNIALLTVPYAFYAAKAAEADNANTLMGQDSSYYLDYNNLNNVPTGSSGSVPPGTVVAFAGDVTKIPTGWLLCDGSEVSRSTYSDLLNVIGIGWGIGDGLNTFNLPDLRGRFLRGVSLDSSNDPDKDSRSNTNSGNEGNKVGSVQGDQYKSHSHKQRYNDMFYDGGGTAGRSESSVNTGNNTGSSGGSETRPKNAYVHYIIKY